jgi:hypothetical protein
MNVFYCVLGDSYMSPSVLANMWKEEEARTKTLETRMRQLLSEKEVKMSFIELLVGIRQTMVWQGAV